MDDADAIGSQERPSWYENATLTFGVVRSLVLQH